MKLVESFRVVVFAPAHAVERVLSAVREVTDLQYGSYAGVSWTSAGGEERFTPLKEASPTMGISGKEQVVTMRRIEFSIPRDRQLLDHVITAAIYPNHEWEEPVIYVTETLDARKFNL